MIQLYQSLDSNAIEAFNKWVSSPIHNPNPIIIKINKYLTSRRKITARSVEKERLTKYLYGEVLRDDMQLRRDCSKMVKVLENFIQFSMSKKDYFKALLNYTNYCKSKDLDKFAQQGLKKAQKLLNNQTQQDANYYYQCFRLEQAWMEHKGTQDRTNTTNLQSIFDHLSTSFIIQYLYFACAAITHQNLYKTSYATPFLDYILKICQEEPYIQIPAIQLYYHAYQCLANPKKEEHFEQLEQGLQEYFSILPISEMRNLYLVAINYCIKRLNTGTAFYVQKGFDLYRKGLEQAILLDKNGEISPFTFSNTVSLGIRLEQFAWVGSFIPQYATYLNHNLRERYILYTNSKLYFAQGDYKKAMQLLVQTNYDDLFLNIDSKMMLLKIYYEEGSYDTLDALLHSFQQFINRKITMGYHKTNYSNIISFTRKLMELPQRITFQQLEKLKNQIQSTEILTEKKWLLDQLSLFKFYPKKAK